MNYVYAASGSLIIVFIFLILRKEKKALADYYLIAINILVGCFMLADVLVQRQLTSASVVFQNGVPLLLFPVFALYVLQFTKAKKRIDRKWHLLYLPAFLLGVLSFVDHFILGNYQTDALIEEHFNSPSIWYQLIFKGSQITFIIVLSWILRQLDLFEVSLKQGYSSIETVDVKWLKHFTWIYLGSIAITFVLFLSQNLGLLPFQINQVFGIVYGILVTSVFYLNYQGIQHYTLSQIYKAPSSNTEHIQETPEVISTPLIQEEKKPLTEEDHQLEQEILAIIESEKLYQEPKFSLDELASLLGKNRHQISKVINAKEGRTFYDLINGYRVNLLKEMMRDPKNHQFTILSMGLESGFNSKASLNRIFKNITGLTPKQYMDEQSHSVLS